MLCSFVVKSIDYSNAATAANTTNTAPLLSTSVRDAAPVACAKPDRDALALSVAEAIVDVDMVESATAAARVEMLYMPSTILDQLSSADLTLAQPEHTLATAA